MKQPKRGKIMDVILKRLNFIKAFSRLIAQKKGEIYSYLSQDSPMILPSFSDIFHDLHYEEKT